MILEAAIRVLAKPQHLLCPFIVGGQFRLPVRAQVCPGVILIESGAWLEQYGGVDQAAATDADAAHHADMTEYLLRPRAGEFQGRRPDQVADGLAAAGEILRLVVASLFQ